MAKDKFLSQNLFLVVIYFYIGVMYPCVKRA